MHTAQMNDSYQGGKSDSWKEIMLIDRFIRLITSLTLVYIDLDNSFIRSNNLHGLISKIKRKYP